CSLYKLRAFP
ncbi:unnamed protein product, partial [Allacma fusca]